MYRRAVSKNSSPAWPGRTALFLDLDGTLLEFAERPDLVEVSVELRSLLPRLANLRDGGVAIVSGRTIADLDRILAPHRFAVAGTHGSQRRDSAGIERQPSADSEGLAPARAAIEKFEAAHDGLVVEDKSISISLHYRLRPDLAAEIAALADEFEQTLTGDYVLMRGKMVIEILPAGVDKGSAIREFMNEAPFAGATPVFIGDDVTDEAGFAVVNELGGVSIKVNHGETVAGWRLDDVRAVHDWLDAVLPRD
jgi:trehalose 6-phosphate phosphatase